MFSSNLSPAEVERLALAAEEMGEAIQVIGKILRHGYESKNPRDPFGPTNRGMLERELGDVRYAIQLLVERGEVRAGEVEECRHAKVARVVPYLHHQQISGSEAR